MLNDSLKILAATPPPAHRLWRYKTSSTASARINELEAALGLPLSERSFNLARANEKIAALEAMLATKAAAPVVAAPVVAAPVAAAPAEAKPVRKLSADAQIAAIKAAGGGNSPVLWLNTLAGNLKNLKK